MSDPSAPVTDPRVERLTRLIPTEHATRRRIFSSLLRTMLSRNEEHS